MQEQRIIISGFGGQGVLLLGKLIAAAGLREGRQVTWLPSYGPEMRGGTANCHVIVSPEPIGAPIVSAATCLLALNLPSLDRFEAAVEPGGLLLYNRSMIPRPPSRSDLRLCGLPINELALAQGSLKVGNVVMLGALLGCCPFVRVETVHAVLRELLGETKQHLLAINVQALDAGRRSALATPAALPTPTDLPTPLAAPPTL